MKVALITDTHFGVRQDSLQFADYFKDFYDNVFFPYLDKHNIKTVFHLGDVVDRRKYINYVIARRLRNDFIKPCNDRGIDLHINIGNHDTTFKNTNEYNSMNELYEHSGLNFKYYSEPQEITLADGTLILMMPWINLGNIEESLQIIENTKAQILFGHLELYGFEMYKGLPNNHGMDKNLFSKFDVVCSGHFHHKSTNENINYLGAPYQMTWSDYGDDRGFHIFDTQTRELTYVVNPLQIFHKIYYNDKDKTIDEVVQDDYSKYKGAYVKMVIINKTNPYWFDMVVDKLEKAGVSDLQVVEDHLNLNIESDSDIAESAEDTMSIVRRYIEHINISDQEKHRVESFLRDLHNEALHLEKV